MTEHRDAVVTFLRTNVNLTVFDGTAPLGTALPYVAVYVYLPTEHRSTLNGPTDYTEVTIITHTIAATVEAAWVVAKQVRLTLLDQRIPVTGLNCSRIEHALGQVPQYDDATGNLIVNAVDQWDYFAIPA